MENEKKKCKLRNCSNQKTSISLNHYFVKVKQGRIQEMIPMVMDLGHR